MPLGPTPHACQSEAVFLNDPEVTELPDQSGIRRRKDQTFPEIRNTGTAGAEEIAEQHWNFWPVRGSLLQSRLRAVGSRTSRRPDIEPLPSVSVSIVGLTESVAVLSEPCETESEVGRTCEGERVSKQQRLLVEVEPFPGLPIHLRKSPVVVDHVRGRSGQMVRTPAWPRHVGKEPQEVGKPDDDCHSRNQREEPPSHDLSIPACLTSPILLKNWTAR